MFLTCKGFGNCIEIVCWEGGGGGETKKLVLDQFIKSVEFSLPYMCVISWGRFVECISVVTGLRAPSKLLATCGENHAK